MAESKYVATFENLLKLARNSSHQYRMSAQLPETGEGSLPVSRLPSAVPQDLRNSKLVAQPVLGERMFLCRILEVLSIFFDILSIIFGILLHIGHYCAENEAGRQLPGGAECRAWWARAWRGWRAPCPRWPRATWAAGDANPSTVRQQRENPQFQ